MAEQYSASSRTNPRQQTPRPGKAGVSTTSDPAQDAPKGKVGVYDRPQRTFGSGSPMLILAFILGLILLLWMLGIFTYLLG